MLDQLHEGEDLTPRRIDPDQLVGTNEIAERASVALATVHKWKTRYDDFPKPIVYLEVGPIYYWPEVERWLNAREDQRKFRGLGNT